MYKIIFFGSQEISASVLQSLIDLKLHIAAVVTRIDKPVGRKKTTIYNNVKEKAMKNNITILQTNKVIEIYESIINLQPDLIITCAFGLLIPKQILKIPKFKCVNIHTSLLPKYRGGAPIQHAIMNNEAQTGITLMYMDKGLDTGDIILQEKINIDIDETYKSLYEKMCQIAYLMCKRNVARLFSNNIKTIKQNEKECSYAPIITHLDEKINWGDTSIKIDAKIRALYDKPVAYTLYQNNVIKIHKAYNTKILSSSKKYGTIEKIDKSGIYVSSFDNLICLTVIQIQSKKIVNIKDLINGKHIFSVGNIFE